MEYGGPNSKPWNTSYLEGLGGGPRKRKWEGLAKVGKENKIFCFGCWEKELMIVKGLACLPVYNKNPVNFT